MREGSGFGAAMRRGTLMMKPFRRRKLPNRWNVVSFYWVWEQYIKCQHFLGNLNFVGYSFHSLWCCCAAPFLAIQDLFPSWNLYEQCVFQQSRQREVCGSIACFSKNVMKLTGFDFGTFISSIISVLCYVFWSSVCPFTTQVNQLQNLTPENIKRNRKSFTSTLVILAAEMG